jgi:hypothetical protein
LQKKIGCFLITVHGLLWRKNGKKQVQRVEKITSLAATNVLEILNDWPLYKNSYGQRLVSWIKNVKHYIFSRELIKVLVNKKKFAR